MRKLLNLSALFFILVILFTACAAPDEGVGGPSDSSALGDAVDEPSDAPPLYDIPAVVVRQAGNDSKGNTYIYEGEGFPTAFSITLLEDGSFSYYEGAFSSYIGLGSWVEEDGIVTLTTSSGYDLVHRFRIEEDRLIFIAEGSDRFIYINVKDGESFNKR